MDNVFVYCETEGAIVAEVSQELLTKGRKLADELGVELHAIAAGAGLKGQVEPQILPYGVDKLFVFDDPVLFPYTSAPHTDILVGLFQEEQPQICLMGATVIGRDLGPRVSSSLTSGLTADCTQLEIGSYTDVRTGREYKNLLYQIRPAFGGNIMANIMTRRTRPQMATVRYKVMNAAPRSHEKGRGIITELKMPENGLRSLIEILSVEKKPAVHGIEHAEVIVAVGRGFKNKADLEIAQKFADEIGAELACSRPLTEASWLEHNRQIGLSGRTVRPKVIVCCGISGAIQFAVGMKGADLIIAINSDPDAPIFQVAHYGIVGDLNVVIPKLIKAIKQKG